jgi:hypothetical protein
VFGVWCTRTVQWVGVCRGGNLMGHCFLGTKKEEVQLRRFCTGTSYEY